MPFDPVRFRRRHPGRALPDLRFCSDRQRWGVNERLAAAFGAVRQSSENILWQLFDRAAPVAVNPTTPEGGVDLAVVLTRCDLRAADYLYLDWYLGEQARVALRDVLDVFDGCREPGVDDIAMFDDSFEWVVYFTRDGGVRLLRAGEPE